MQDLRTRLEGLGGAEIRDRFQALGPEALLEAIGVTVEELRALKRGELEGLEGLTEKKLATLERPGVKEETRS